MVSEHFGTKVFSSYQRSVDTIYL